MKEKMKNVKLDVTFSAILSVAVGVLFVIKSEAVISVLARLIAVLFVISGLVLLIPRLVEPVKKYLSIIVALIVTIIGVWMFLSPQLMASAIPIAIGVILVVHGLQDLALAVEAKNKNGKNWWTIALYSLLNIFLGALCICNAFGLVKVGLIFIGIMMIYDGLSDMVIVHKVNKATRNMVVDTNITHEEDVDEFGDFM